MGREKRKQGKRRDDGVITSDDGVSSRKANIA